MRLPLVLVCLEGGDGPFVICANMAERVVEEMNRNLHHEERQWQVHTEPFPALDAAAVMEEHLFPAIAMREAEDMAQLCDDCGGWLEFETDPEDGAVTCTCPACGMDPEIAAQM